jgi:hypothetical protein
VHIRRGNKVLEAPLTPTEKYINPILDMMKRTQTNHLYLATDSNVAIREVLQLLPNITLHIDHTQRRFEHDPIQLDRAFPESHWHFPEQALGKTSYWNNKAMISIIVDLFFMTHSQEHLGTRTSNVFVTVNYLRSILGMPSGISV